VKEFSYFMPSRIVLGKGSTERIAEYVQGERILIICDPFMEKCGAAQKIAAQMPGCSTELFSGIEPNPSCESVDAATAAARKLGATTVVGIGGGSALDVSKIVACLTTQEGSIYDYYAGGTRKLGKRTVRLICIPTTSGTGSEVTNVGVFTNSKTHIKMPFVTHEFWPDVALLDPELTFTLPPAVTASTGMDAFCHAIESYWNKDSQPISDVLAVEAMRLILQYIKTAYDDGTNIEAREQMQLASLLAGVAFSQTRTTGIHALSFPLTTEYGASHGLACSITLPAFIRIVKEGASQKMAALCAALGYAHTDEMAQEIENLMISMNMPVRLSQIGVKEEALDHITQVGLGAAIIKLTPATMNEETVKELLRAIL